MRLRSSSRNVCNRCFTWVCTQTTCLPGGRNRNKLKILRAIWALGIKRLRALICFFRARFGFQLYFIHQVLKWADTLIAIWALGLNNLLALTKFWGQLAWGPAPGGGGTQLFSGRGVQPGFPKCGACELTFASEKGGLWAENFQIWGLVSWKFPNLGACELRFGWKLRLLRLQFPNFLKRGSCELTLLLEMGPLRAAGEAWKGGLQGRTSLYPLSRSVPPGGPAFFRSMLLPLVITNTSGHQKPHNFCLFGNNQSV